MPFSLWTFAFLVFVAPGFVFLTTFAASSRFRRNGPGDVLSTVIALFLASLGAAVVVLLVDGMNARYFITHAVELIPPATSPYTSPRPEAYLDTAYLERVGRFVGYYLFFTSVFAAVAGLICAKAIVWGIVRLQFYHGPLYPVIHGFFRYDVIATIVTRLSVKKMDAVYGEIKDLPIMYRGALHDILLGHDGTIEYVAIRRPSKGFFIPPDAHIELQRAEDHFTPIGLDENASSNRRVRFSNDFVLIEGEDIQNVYFTRVDGISIDLPLRGAVKRFIVGHRHAICIVALSAVGGFLIHPILLITPALLWPPLDAIAPRRR